MNNKDYINRNYVRVFIPTTSDFLKQWHLWIHGKVTKHFKRDKERIPDAVQRARLRLLSKDFVARWFYKHLTDDLVDLAEASNMLGGVSVTYIGKLLPAFGVRSSPDSLWRVSDILKYAKFDYERYFYSIQDHTIDTNKVLRLLGYGSLDSNGNWSSSASDFGALESLYRQGRIKPSEFTEHECVQAVKSIRHTKGLCGIHGCANKHFSRGYCCAHYNQFRNQVCEECQKGRESLKTVGISLANRWSDPKVSKAVLKLRWNDSQLADFLRDWKNSNKITGLPRHIIRIPSLATIDAGLLKYANMIIDNDVINNFKTMGRFDDIQNGSTGKSASDSVQVTAAPKHDETGPEQEFVDVSMKDVDEVERRKTLLSIIRKAALTQEEMTVIQKADFEETSIKEVADYMALPISRINKIRVSALSKMKVAAQL